MKELTIEYSQTDPTAKPDSTPTTTDIQPFGDISLLKYDDIDPPGNYMTLEHNYSLLDGSMKHIQNAHDQTMRYWGWFSKSMSKADGYFTTPPTIDITFVSVHKSPGITFRFYPYTDDYASLIRITWYSATGSVIKTGTYENNSTIGEIVEPVADYKRIKAEMLKTNNPYRYIKMYAIDYGITHIIPDNMINTAGLLEEIDPISDILSVNTLNFNILHKNPPFIVYDNTDENLLMKMQKMTLTVNKELYGVFFLQSWRDNTLNNISYDFECIDAVGVMENYMFMGGMYGSQRFSEMIDRLFELCFPTHIVKYQIDESIYYSTITGYFPIMNCREALQWLCFAVGATADTSRRNYVWIYPRDTETTYEIPREQVYRNGSMEILPYVSGVDVTAHEFIKGTETIELHKSTMQIGTYTILFSEPVHTLAITGGTILSNNENHAVINVPAYGGVVISGRRYIHNSWNRSVRDPYILAGEIESVVLFEKCTLINPNNAQKVAQNIFDYYKNRISVDSDIIHNDKEVGYKANISLQNDKTINGIIESVDINLRANRAKARITGNVT